MAYMGILPAVSASLLGLRTAWKTPCNLKDSLRSSDSKSSSFVVRAGNRKHCKHQEEITGLVIFLCDS